VILNSNNDNIPWFTYSLEGGFKLKLKNLNILKLGIIANVSFTDFVEGTYKINIPGEELTEGTYKFTGSYIGLSVGYCLTRKKASLTK